MNRVGIGFGHEVRALSVVFLLVQLDLSSSFVGVYCLGKQCSELANTKIQCEKKYSNSGLRKSPLNKLNPSLLPETIRRKLGECCIFHQHWCQTGL